MKSPRILLVDDETPLRRALARPLISAGFTVIEAHGLNDALERLHTDRIDLIVTDLRLPDGDGMQLAWTAQQSFPDMRTLIMSGYATGKDQQVASNLGVVSVLHKPFSAETLIQQVELAIDCRNSFFGNLHGLTLVDILQMYHYGKKNVSISVGGPTGGRIDVHDGEVIDAEFHGLKGEEALRALLALQSGWIQTAPLRAVRLVRIERSFEMLIMDSMRMIDEAGLH